MSKLSDRLRTIVGAPSRSSVVSAPGPPDLSVQWALESILGGSWRNSCLVVEQRRESAAVYGRQTVGQMANRMREGATDVALVAPGASARPPFIFFDVETTGLSGGAGTYAFLVGCGWFDSDDGFVTRQFVLTRFADERALLTTFAGELAGAGSLVSFNGKAFDAPLLETRCLFHRLDWFGDRLPHLDMLHLARRFWGEAALGRPVLDSPGRRVRGQYEREWWGPASQEKVARAAAAGVGPGDIENRGILRESEDGDADRDCSLIALERRILGARRVGDAPGYEIPSRYFQFLRSGDASPLSAVLEHNRLDLLSLAGLTARLLHLVRIGPSEAADARQAMALGRLYARAGLESRAIESYRAALSKVRSNALRVEILRSLALTLRRARRFEEASGCWRDLLALPTCPQRLARQASEALAIYHEHRVRDFALAKTFALGSLDDARSPSWNRAVEHRVARIERKLRQAQVDW